MLIDPELGVLPPVKAEAGRLPVAYYLGKGRSDHQEEAESDRIVYVAATRARTKLTSSGCSGLKRDGTPSKPAGWLGKLTEPACLGLTGSEVVYDEQWTGAVETALEAGETPVSCTVYEPGYAAALGQCRAAAGSEAVGTLPPHWLEPLTPGSEKVDPKVSEQERIPVQRVWRIVATVERPRAPAWMIGPLVHEALAPWRVRADPDLDFKRWAEARARGHDLTDARQLADTVARSRQ